MVTDLQAIPDPSVTKPSCPVIHHTTVINEEEGGSEEQAGELGERESNPISPPRQS